MTAAERQFFLEAAREFTGLACLAQTLAANCESSGHGRMANPEAVEGQFWNVLNTLRPYADGLRARRERLRPVEIKAA